ncbi:MAG: hypothetical protein JWP58_1787 [Hymenobacter sp.]|nr:hypothetical protein [Hymenobacter sp.]
MTIETIKQKGEQLKAALATIESNRKLWQDEKKGLLKTTLEQIKSELGFDMQVQSLTYTTNSEGINLTFNNGYSGIYEKTKTSMKSYAKHGGYIVFSQAYNGKVFVIIGYPYIEGIVTQGDAIAVGKFNPEEITADFIYKQVSFFLDEMIKWEIDTSVDSQEDEARANSVGFVFGKTPPSQ